MSPRPSPIHVHDPALEGIVGVALGGNGLAGAVAVLGLKVRAFPPEWPGEKIGVSVAIHVTKRGSFGVNAGVKNLPDMGRFVRVTGGDD